MSRVVKPVKVSSWSWEMSLETFVKQLEIWESSNVDVPINTQYQDLVKSLKVNKDVKGLAKYVGEQILPVLSTQEQQTVKEVIDCLKKKYGRTRLEK